MTGRQWRNLSKENRRGIQDRPNMEKIEQRESKRIHDRQNIEKFEQKE
jgi:hypothetical protein